jgi:hypothetical protein
MKITMYMGFKGKKQGQIAILKNKKRRLGGGIIFKANASFGVAARAEDRMDSDHRQGATKAAIQGEAP